MAIYEQYMTKNGTIPSEPQTGNDLWTKLTSSNALIDIAKYIPVDKAVGIKSRDELTVPSPWSAVISFDLLLDTKTDYGKVKENVINEWRMLIMLLALRKIRNIPITFDTIDLKSINAGDFSNNVLDQYPKNGIYKDSSLISYSKDEESWSKITFIKLCDEVIGMLTPSNIVCSKYYYREKTNHRSIEWLRKNGLMPENELIICDPIQYILTDTNHMKQKQSYEYICAWLEKIIDFLTEKDSVGEFIFKNTNELVGRVKEYLTEIKARGNDYFGEPVKVVLKSGVETEEFRHPREMIESIQGEYSRIGMLTALAYSNFSQYDIEYIRDRDDSRKKCAGDFHKCITDDPMLNAIMIGTQCIGALSSKYGLSLPTNALPVRELIECGLMNDGSEYNDPVTFATKTPQRYVYIRSWMEHVRNTIAQIPGLKSANDIINEIDSFIKRIAAEFIAKANPADSNTADRLFADGFVTIMHQGPLTSMYDLFANMIIQCDIDKTGIANSASLLNNTSTSWIVFSAETIGADLLNFYNKSRRNLPGIRLITPQQSTEFDVDKIFESKIYYVSIIESEKKRLNSDRNKTNWWSISRNVDGIDMFYTVLWPIKEEVFDILDPDVIYNGISIDYNSETNKCKITLTLPLMDAAKNNTVTKEFDGPAEDGHSVSSGVIPSYLLPGVSIWPYVIGNESANGSAVSVSDSYSIYESKQMKTKEDVPMKNRYEVQCMPGHAETKWKMMDRLSSEGDFERRIGSRTTIPQYLVVKDNVSKEYYGAVLLRKPDSIPSAGGATMHIGLDFGTSSTTVYARMDGTAANDSVPIDLTKGQETYTPIEHTWNDADSYFVTNSYSSNPYYPSLLRNSSYHPNVPAVPFFGGNIIYQYKFSQSSDTFNDKSEVKSDIKWSEDNENDTNEYLRQLVMQILLYAKSRNASSINWHASYPSAFSDEQKIRYETRLNTIIKTVHSQVGNITFGNATEFSLETESIAAAKYILEDALEKHITWVTVVDIGGGSTDVSAWRVGGSAPTALFQTSIEVASRKLFRDPLVELVKNSPNLQTHIENKGAPYTSVKAYADPINGDEKKLRVLVEQLLLLDGDELYSIIDGIDAPGKGRFYNKVSAGFYAMMYYTIKTFIAKIPKEEIPDIMLIRLGGNGAKMYDWIQPVHKQRIITLLEKKLGGRTQIQIQFNKNDAKTEAARGLLYNVDKGITPPEPIIICGSDVELSYTDMQNNKCSLVIKADDDMKAIEEVRACYDNQIGYRADKFRLVNDVDGNYNKAIQEFVGDIQAELFANAVDMDNKILDRMNSDVEAVMIQSLKSRRIMSPLFAQLMTIVGSIK